MNVDVVTENTFNVNYVLIVPNVLTFVPYNVVSTIPIYDNVTPDVPHKSNKLTDPVPILILVVISIY